MRYLLEAIAQAPRSQPEREPANAHDPAALKVRLHFGSEAGLDLHVTDPKQETVYFGNSPSLGGGVLERDLRCNDPAPRTELVTFATPEPGRYRVGVDFITTCRRLRDPIPFEIEVIRGEVLQRIENEISPGRFRHIVLEFEIPG